MSATAARFAPQARFTSSDIASILADMRDEESDLAWAEAEADENAACVSDLDDRDYDEGDIVDDAPISREQHERDSAMLCYELWQDYPSFEDFVAAHPYGWSYVGEGPTPDFLFCYPSGFRGEKRDELYARIERDRERLMRDECPE